MRMGMERERGKKKEEGKKKKKWRVVMVENWNRKM